jgi:hypothetical protein
MIDNAIAQVISGKIQEAGVTIGACSKGTGISNTYIRRILNGEAKTYTETIQRLIAFLDATIAEKRSQPQSNIQVVPTVTQPVVTSIQQTTATTPPTVTSMQTVNQLPSMQTQTAQLPTMHVPTKDPTEA